NERPHSRGAISRPGLANIALETARAQGMPGARRTHCLACKTKKTDAGSTQVRRHHSGTPCAMGLRLLRDLPGEPAFLPPSPASHLAGLSPALAGHGHTGCAHMSRVRA